MGDYSMVDQLCIQSFTKLIPINDVVTSEIGNMLPLIVSAPVVTTL